MKDGFSTPQYSKEVTGFGMAKEVQCVCVTYNTTLASSHKKPKQHRPVPQRYLHMAISLMGV